MLGLDKDLLDTSLAMIKQFVQFVHILQADAMGYNIQWIDLTLLDLLEEILPILLNWSLAIANEPDTCLHQSTDVEVVCLVVVSSLNKVIGKCGCHVHNQRRHL